MKVLAVSDLINPALHSSAVCELAQGVELIISCGDLPSHYLDYLVTMLNVPMVWVMGNHGGRGGSKEYPEGGTNIDNQSLYYKGLLIAGLEGSLRYNDRPRYQYTQREMWWKVLRLVPQLWANKLHYGRYLDVLVTHAPPYGIHDGRDLPHTGFQSFLWLIDHFRPRYLVHGHIHVYDNRTVMQTVRGATLVVNAYNYKVLDIPAHPYRRKGE